MLCIFLNFEKLIGVNLSVHITDMRCLKRGARASGPFQLKESRFPQPHRVGTYHLLCLPKMPWMKPNSMPRMNLINPRGLTFLVLNYVGVVIVATIAVRTNTPLLKRSVREPVTLLVGVGLVKFATTLATLVVCTHSKNPPILRLVPHTTRPMRTLMTRRPKSGSRPRSLPPATPSRYMKLRAARVPQMRSLVFIVLLLWARGGLRPHPQPPPSWTSQLWARTRDR